MKGMVALMKKFGLIPAAAICAAMLLSGCTEYGFSRDPNYAESSEIGESSSSAPRSSSSDNSDNSVNSVNSDSKPLNPLNNVNADEDLLEAAYSNMLITMYADGSFSGSVSADEADKARSICAMRQLFSDESYEAVNSVYGSLYPTKKDYVKSIFEFYADMADYFDEDGNLKTAPAPALYIEFDSMNGKYAYGDDLTVDPETEKQAFFRAAEWVMGKLGDEELRKSVIDYMNENGCASASVDYSVDGEGVIDVDAHIDTDDEYAVFGEKFHISGKDGFVLGDTFVLCDTEKLVLSSRDSSTLSFATSDFIPDGCKVVCSERDIYDMGYDLAEIAEKLPNLKELYMYQANCTNREAVADMKNLEALSYFVLREYTEDDIILKAVADCPFKGLKNLRTLRLYADYEDYSFLNEMPWLENIHVEVRKTDGGFESLFNCPGITSLDIDGWLSNMKFDIDGIEKLTRLKKLRLTCEALDFTPLGMLQSIDDLYVSCTSAALNIEALSNAKSISKLFLSGIKYVDDWRFLQDMPNLTELSLYYVRKIKNSDLAPLKQLTSLTLSESGCNVAAVAELPNLEVYAEIMSDGGDFSVFEKCTHLRELYLLGCAEGVMDCAYVRNAPLEVFCCNGTAIANPELLAEIKTLRSISIATDGGIDCGDLLREALPDCEIDVDSPSSFHNGV